MRRASLSHRVVSAAQVISQQGLQGMAGHFDQGQGQGNQQFNRGYVEIVFHA